MYLSAPFFGKLVDARGPRASLVSAFFLLLGGYIGIRTLYDGGTDAAGHSLSTAHFVLLVLCGFCTGLGGDAGLTSAVNTSAKTFPDKAVRGSLPPFSVLPR